MPILATRLSGEPTVFGRGFVERSISSSVLSGSNPVEVDTSNPITLFIVQLFVIIVFTQGLGWAFAYMKQPRVIAEVIGGIILGPSILGRIPNFSKSIFPTASLTYLNLVSTIGLILFLFLVGLEVDVGVAIRNGRQSAIISLAGMCIPFGLGAAVAIPVYNNFVDTKTVSFGHFLLFIGVAMSITAFPVLCRILTATKLIDTRVGVMVLSAGVGNDVVGWVLLALTLALVNSGTGVTAVYVLLCAVGWGILLLWPIRKGFVWLARRTGSIDNGPTPGMMVLTLLIVFASAFITDIIGVHPIFGGFISGLIIPHEGGFAIAVTEKIDDLVSMLFLPIYFVLSGLQTNLGLLDTGRIWGYVIMICSVAFTGKFFGCAGAAKLLKYNWRESAAIGLLMSCKGLVELIVLNVGLSAGIIDQQLFSMFVVEAIVLTFMTTPLTLLVYPERCRSRASGEADKSRLEEKGMDRSDPSSFSIVGRAAGGREYTSKFLVVLQKIEHLAAVMFLTQMLEPPPAPSSNPWKASSLPVDSSSAKRQLEVEGDISEASTKSSPEQQLETLPTIEIKDPANDVVIHIDALKLIELTGRTFSVMQSAERDQLLVSDDALQLYRQFGRLRGIEITPHISIVGQESFPSAVVDYASDLGTELVLIPWTIPVTSESTSSTFNAAGPSNTAEDGFPPNSSVSAFESIFGTDTQGSPMYTHFVRHVFTRSNVDVALFVDRGFGGSASFSPGSGQHIFLPFFGGADDRLALRLVVQLCHHANVTATVIRFENDSTSEEESDDGTVDGKTGSSLPVSDSIKVHQTALQSNQLTIGGAKANDAQTRVASDTADNLAWSYYSSPTGSTSSAGRSQVLQTVLPRIAFSSHRSSKHLADAITYANAAISAYSKVTTLSGGVNGAGCKCRLVADQRAQKARQGQQTLPGPTVSRGSWRPLLVVVGRSRHGVYLDNSQELNKMLADKGLNPSLGAELRKTVGDTASALMLVGGKVSASSSFLVLEAGQRR